MKNRIWLLTVLCLVLAVLFSGCGGSAVEETTVPVETTEETLPPPTVPEPGNYDDVTCKGTYTVTDDVLTQNADKTVAVVGTEKLSVAELQLYYWMEVARFRQSGAQGPDFSQSLDTQLCDIDETAITWQQYFLQRALETWHTYQTLMFRSADEGIPTEAAYMPNEKNHIKYMTDMPATKVLYGYNPYHPNSMHQAYLDEIPNMLQTLAEEKGLGSVEALAADMAGGVVTADMLADYTEDLNRAYMYFTELHYLIKPTEEDVTGWFEDHKEEYKDAGITKDSGKTVNVRHILLIPEPITKINGKDVKDPELLVVSVSEDGTVNCSEALWENCVARAEKLIKTWRNNWERSEYTFADMAHKQSADPGSNKNGGMYSHVRPGQLAKELDEWCFAENRQPGDMEIIRTQWGIHVMYFSGTNEDWYEAAEDDWVTAQDAQLLQQTRDMYPLMVKYSAICLGEPENSGEVTVSDNLLYADISHQRYPEVPLFLQQDYPKTMYGYYPIVTHGCGITTLAMISSYFTDEDMFPEKMCGEYADYCYSNGTDGSLFQEAPAEMNYYIIKKTYNCGEAQQALKDGHLVVVAQRAGYWTRGGHYLVMERMLEDGMIQVRDSNIFNYGRLLRHKEDSFPWNCITPNGIGYWIFDFKRTSIPACVRCGDANTEGMIPGLLTQEYYCEKCDSAMIRRDNYLALCGE